MSNVFVTLKDYDLFINESIPLFYYDSIKQLQEYEGDVEYRELTRALYNRLIEGEEEDTSYLQN